MNKSIQTETLVTRTRHWGVTHPRQHARVLPLGLPTSYLGWETGIAIALAAFSAEPFYLLLLQHGGKGVLRKHHSAPALPAACTAEPSETDAQANQESQLTNLA